jgi:hypothetical protein
MKGARKSGEMNTVALAGKPKNRQLEVIHLEGNIILKWIIKSI